MFSRISPRRERRLIRRMEREARATLISGVRLGFFRERPWWLPCFLWHYLFRVFLTRDVYDRIRGEEKS